ncbi:ATP-binding cassette domain-containing protein [bacterium]|nr:MAG: ATP-binding cassette domain-containing protein [bacterium]
MWPHFILAMLCMLVYSATSGATPYLTKRIFDDVFANKSETMLKIIPFALVGVFALRGLMSYGEDYLMAYINGRVVNHLRNKLYAHIASLSLSFYQRHPTGSLMTRITGDTGLAAGALTGVLVSLIRDGTSLIALTTAAFVMDPLLGLIAFVVFPASVLPVMKLGKKIKKLTKKGQVTVGNFTSLMQETIQGARIVKAFSMEEYERGRFEKENERLFKLGIRATRIRAAVKPAMELLAAFAIGGVVWYGGYSVIAGARTQGQFMAFMAAMFLMYQPFKKLASINATIQQGTVGAERVFEILDTESDVLEKPGAGPAPRFSREIEFHNVGFGYERKLVLKDINLKIGAGEMVALVGVSGVGKSTLADLIPRFYDVTSGKMTIDGLDIRDVTLESLRSQIGIVTQHTFLFNDTVKNNIAYGDRSKDMEHIIAAAKAAYAHDFVMAMPQGYDTVIGEMGLRLSGGERQRIAIARALLKDPPILILDEATSSLDSESERLVQEALERLMIGRTALVIAHRLSTIRKANHVIVLVDGTITEEGTHEELLARKAEYNKLYTLQLLEGGEGRRGKFLH